MNRTDYLPASNNNSFAASQYLKQISFAGWICEKYTSRLHNKQE